MEETRSLHLCGATGQVRTETKDGREYLVVPVVALMEGVIHPVNAETPEFVPCATLIEAAATWNGRPVTLGHPKRGGKQCSANDPEIVALHGMGTIYNSHVSGTKLLQEAWIEKSKAKKLNPDMYRRLEDGERMEVSVGAHVVTDPTAGTHNARSYKASWRKAAGDHLAFLPDGRGACSIEMGCGAHRAAMHFVTAESIEWEGDMVGKVAVATLRALMPRGWGDDEVKQDLREALHEIDPAARNGEILRVTNNEVVYCIYPPPAQATGVYDQYPTVWPSKMTYWRRGYTFDAATRRFTLGDVREQVEPTTVYETLRGLKGRPAYKDCPACDGTGSLNGNPCETCDGNGELKVAAFNEDQPRDESGKWASGSGMVGGNKDRKFSRQVFNPNFPTPREKDFDAADAALLGSKGLLQKGGSHESKHASISEAVSFGAAARDTLEREGWRPVNATELTYEKENKEVRFHRETPLKWRMEVVDLGRSKTNFNKAENVVKRIHKLTGYESGEPTLIKASNESAAPSPQLKAAGCGCNNKASACGCKGVSTMAGEKPTRAEIIAALTTDQYSGFDTGDVAMLETASDARLEQFRAAAEGRKTEAAAFTRLQNEHRNTEARLKVSEERLKTAQEPMTEEEFLAKAPAKIKAVLETLAAEEATYRGSLVGQLKDLGAHSEDQLKAMSTEHLEALAKYARITVPDFSGRGVAVHRAASQNNDYAPPNPYAAAMAQKKAAVN